MKPNPSTFPNYHADSDRLAILWERIIDFNDRHFPNWRSTPAVYFSNAMAGEVGEVCSVTKRLAGGGTNSEAHSGENRYIKLQEEIVDVFIYSVLLMQSNHIDLDEFFVAAEAKLRELERRVSWSEQKW
uniref:Putative nucleotide pyrophosphohydrolase domain-containing protein n=1 Tax=viral metagenome TaxID=1070528 RepID=A0A6M3JJ63_9ZZZZ